MEKPLSESEKDRIVSLANDGLTIADISRETGISRYRVGNLIYKAFGITDNGKPWTYDDIAILHKCAADGERVHQVALRLHRTINSVQKRASTLGIHFRLAGRSDIDILSPNIAARNYAAVKHKLDRLAHENLSILPGKLVRILPSVQEARHSSSIVSDSFFPGAAQARVVRST